MGNEMQRGYDDTAYLTDMASGLLSRKYHSVDEAAKAVLSEDGGSNVDRLRRKFREQNWYEKGLSDYVEAEIASRNLIAEPGYHRIGRQVMDRIRAPFESLQIVNAAIGDRIRVKPKNSMVAFSLVTTLMFVAAASGLVTMTASLFVAVACCVLLMVAWADKTSEAVSAKTACIHLSGMGVLTAGLVAVFGYADPSPEFTMGSQQGALALVIGLTVMGVYSTSFIGFQTRKNGTRKTLEVGCLIAALSAFSQLGTAILVHDGFASAAQVAEVVALR